MQGQVENAENGNVVILGTKSWTAFIRPLLLALLVLGLVLPVVLRVTPGIGLILPLLLLAYLAIKLLEVRSFVLYQDKAGVWLSYGLFPWNKGTIGIKWRDIEIATYYPNFTSWLFNSYTVRVAHRFTRESEIFVKGIANGKAAVIAINEIHQQTIEAGNAR